MRVIKQRIVTAVIESFDEKILMGRKRPNKASVYPKCWHLPGGGTNSGETDIDAIIREVREETGLILLPGQVEPIDYVGYGEDVRTLFSGQEVLTHMLFIAFRARLSGRATEIKTSETFEFMHLQWFAKNELSSVKLAPPSYPLLTSIGYLAIEG